ncbi:general secretion pathway protein D [Rhizomicrobium palustre]|uniref:General secretion pathway protein D n=1 Tax=Rhizomicrobium palustre TaxID=189966 RepID=A0A846N0F6_9PROT|nr:general secretion pathway protein D [Rhizomicrobium palustre]
MSAASRDDETEGLPTRSSMVRGSGILMDTSVAKRGVAKHSPSDVTLNFVSASVQDVAKAILGDLLGLTYTVDPSAQGSVTVETTSPVRRDQVLGILETSLQAAKLTLVQNGALYSIVPLSAAQHRGTLVDPGNSGYGSEAVPLRFVNAAELKKVIDPLVPENGLSLGDPSRNVMIVTGSANQRQTMRNLIRQFDVNWLKGMSFALLVPQWSDSQSVATQLKEILDADGMPTHGMVRIMPIRQGNGILVISGQASYLDQARKMVEMIDREAEGSQRRLFVYNVQNGRAADIASVLSAAFGGGSQAAGQTNLATAGTAGKNGSVPSAKNEFSSGSGNDVLGTNKRTADAAGQAIKLGASGEEMTVTADETNNALVIYATPPQYEIVKNALHRLDVPPLQVMVQAAITEVSLTDEIHFGVQWFFQARQNTYNMTQGTAAALVPSYPGFNYIFSNNDNIKVVLNALSNITKVNVLSSPQLFVLNNHTATLQVGDQVPVATQSAVSTDTAGSPIVNSIEYRDTGIILRVTPRVNDSGLVLLDISQEVSEVGTTSSSKINSPTIQQRRIASSIAVRDGQTIALGGLIKETRNDANDGIPFLNRIPLLGRLLGSTDNVRGRTELLILLTPRVVRNPGDAEAMTDEITSKMKSIEPHSAAARPL